MHGGSPEKETGFLLTRPSNSDASHRRSQDGLPSWHCSLSEVRSIIGVSHASSVSETFFNIHASSPSGDLLGDHDGAASTGDLGGDPETPTGIPRSVFVLYLVAFLSHWTQTLTEFITWFVIEARAWSHADDTSYYGLVYGIFLFGPVVMNPTVGWLSDRVAIKGLILTVHLVAATGVALMAVAQSETAYALGAFLYACLAVRPLRTTYIAMATHPGVRTRAMAYLNLATDCSKFVGVMSAKALARYGPQPPAYWDFVGWQVDYLTLALLAALLLLLLNTTLVALLFEDQTGRSARLRLPIILWTKDVKVETTNSQVRWCDGNRFARTITVYFCCIGFLHQVSFGLITVANLPVLSHVFQLSASAVADVKLCQDLLPCAAPLLVAQLSTVLADRSLLLTGLLCALFGVAVFAAPLSTGMTAWQPLAGMVCMAVAQQFFYTADFSVFSKVLGPRASGVRMAVVASASALGATLGASLGGQVSEQLYGSWMFFALSTPSVVATLLVLNPWFFRTIGPGAALPAQLVAQWKADEAAAYWDACGTPRRDGP